MPAKTIDGNDLLGVHAAAGDAIAKLRRAEGPYLLECMTYRMAGHFVGDAQHYRSKEELAAMKQKCPIERLKRHLIERGVAESELEMIGEEARQEVLQAAERARAQARPDPATVLEYVYSAPSLAMTSG
jgi:pyruvate dehydrogenase E1 component alpha subunit